MGFVLATWCLTQYFFVPLCWATTCTLHWDLYSGIVVFPLFLFFVLLLWHKHVYMKNAQFLGKRRSKWERPCLYWYLQCFVTLWTEWHLDSRAFCCLLLTFLCHHVLCAKFFWTFPRCACIDLTDTTATFLKLFLQGKSEQNRYESCVFVEGSCTAKFLCSMGSLTCCCTTPSHPTPPEKLDPLNIILYVSTQIYILFLHVFAFTTIKHH